MKIMNLENVDKFVNVVEQSKGDVILHTEDGTDVNLKKDKNAAKILKFAAPRTTLDLTVKDPDDSMRFVRYMMDA